MSKPIPLGTTLCFRIDLVVIHRHSNLRAPAGKNGLSNGQSRRLGSPDRFHTLLLRWLRGVGGQQIEHPKLGILAEESPGISRWSVGLYSRGEAGGGIMDLP